MISLRAAFDGVPQEVLLDNARALSEHNDARKRSERAAGNRARSA